MNPCTLALHFVTYLTHHFQCHFILISTAYDIYKEQGVRDYIHWWTDDIYSQQKVGYWRQYLTLQMALLSMSCVFLCCGPDFAFLKAKFKLKTDYTNISHTQRVSWPRTKLFSLLRIYVSVIIDKTLGFHISFSYKIFSYGLVLTIP